MSPVTYNNGEQSWYPKSEASETSFNFGHRNEQKRIEGTFKCVAKMMELEAKGNVSEDDVSRCIELNAEKLDMSQEDLRDEALKILANKEDD